MNQDKKFENICKFYATTQKLKTLLRTGWLQWNVKADRLESVAEHIYGSQMLALAIYDQFELDLDIKKVIFMLAFHELGENLIGDVTPVDEILREIKHKKEREAVAKVLQPLVCKKQIYELFLEYDQGNSEEAVFARIVDHFEASMQMKYYQETGCTKNCSGVEIELLKKKFKDAKNACELWISEHISHELKDENFIKLAQYVVNNDIYKVN